MSEGGGGPSLSVVSGDVRALGGYACDLADVLREALRSAGREVDALTSGGWTGSAATAFARGWAEVHDGGHDLLDALTALASALDITAGGYGIQDGRFAAEVSSLDLP